MAEPTLNLLGGLMTGFVGSKNAARDRNSMEEYRKAMTDHVKTQAKLDEQKINLAMMKMQGPPQSLINALNNAGGGQGQPQPAQGTPSAPVAQAPQPLPQQMAGMINPLNPTGGQAPPLSIGPEKATNLLGGGFLNAPATAFAGLQPTFADRVAALGQEYFKATGEPLRISDAYRTREQQADVYAKKPNLALPPGSSNHERGLAIDIDPNQAKKITEMGLLQKHGFIQPALSKGEIYHLELGGQGQPQPQMGQPQQPQGQQLIVPNFPKETGISNMPVGNRLALDIYFKQTYDLDTKFRETKGKFKLHGTPESGYQIINEDNGQIVTLPPTVQKQTRYDFTTPSGAGGFGYAPDAIRTPTGGGPGTAPGGIPQIGGGGGAGPVVMNKPPVVTWDKGTTPGGGTYEYPKPQAQMGMDPIITGPEKGANASEAGRIQLAQSGLEAHKQLENLIFDVKTGKSNWKTLAQSVGPGVPWTEGRNIQSLIFRAADAIIRAATGAALNREELTAYAKTYAPSVFDNEATVQSKMQGLRQFLNGYLEKMDPTEAARLRMGPIVGPMGQSGFNAPAISPTSKEPPTNPNSTKRMQLPGVQPQPGGLSPEGQKYLQQRGF